MPLGFRPLWAMVKRCKGLAAPVRELLRSNLAQTLSPRSIIVPMSHYASDDKNVGG